MAPRTNDNSGHTVIIKDDTRMTPREQARFRLLKAIEGNPGITQRELATEVGVSLGRANYLLKALIEKGLVKIGNFSRNANNLSKISYLLTAEGVRDRAALTARYLERKKLEYELLRQEIEFLERNLPAENSLKSPNTNQG